MAEFARNFVDQLFVVLRTTANDVLDANLRRRWLEELLPRVRVLPFAGELSELRQWLSAYTGSIDYVFGSGSDCAEIATIFGAQFVPIDPEKTILPVHSADVCLQPLKYWQFLPDCVRAHFVKRVCIFGPESTGKSTLTKNLAAHFQTIAVPEWARTMISHRNDELLEEDLPTFARGQSAAEDALARQANRVLFVDTDAIITAIWSDWLYGRVDPAVLELAEKRHYDLYLLTDVDVPWVADPQRYLPEKRREFFDRCRLELEKRDRQYVVVRGDWEKRFDTAVAAVIEKCLSSQAVPGCKEQI